MNLHVKLQPTFLICRNGLVRCECIVRLRTKLDELGRVKGVHRDKQGEQIVILELVVIV